MYLNCSVVTDNTRGWCNTFSKLAAPKVKTHLNVFFYLQKNATKWCFISKDLPSVCSHFRLHSLCCLARQGRKDKEVKKNGGILSWPRQGETGPYRQALTIANNIIMTRGVRLGSRARPAQISTFFPRSVVEKKKQTRWSQKSRLDRGWWLLQITRSWLLLPGGGGCGGGAGGGLEAGWTVNF